MLSGRTAYAKVRSDSCGHGRSQPARPHWPDLGWRLTEVGRGAGSPTVTASTKGDPPSRRWPRLPAWMPRSQRRNAAPPLASGISDATSSAARRNLLEREHDPVGFVSQHEVEWHTAGDAGEHVLRVQPLRCDAEPVADQAEAGSARGGLRYRALIDHLCALGQERFACLPKEPVGRRGGKPRDANSGAPGGAHGRWRGPGTRRRD